MRNVIIGSGVYGLSTAIELITEGMDVTIIDSDNENIASRNALGRIDPIFKGSGSYVATKDNNSAQRPKDQRPKDERDALNDVRVRHRSQTADRFDDEHDERKDENTTVLTDGAVGERLDDFTHRHELRDLVTKDWQQETAPRQHTKRVRRGLISRIRRAESIVHEFTQREIPARFPQRVESRRHDQKAHVHAHTRGNPSRGEPSLQPRLPRDPLDGVSRE